MMASRLRQEEIDRTVARIRSEYDHYIVHFLKTPEAKRQFDERYTAALRHRMDMTLFLGAEIQVIQTLIAKAKDETVRPPRAPARPIKKQSYADRVLEQLQAKIKDYPALGLPDHPEKSPDVDKLYGTLRWFRKELWEHLYPVLLVSSPSPALFAVDTELGQLTLQGERWPKEIETYWALLNSRADLSQVARAQNRCLLLGGQLLGRIRRLLEGVDAQQALEAAEREVVTKALRFIDRVLSDFRLKELVSRS